MRWLYAIIDLIFYGNFWIATCALGMCVMTNRFLGINNIASPICVFVFGGTLFIYGVHRSVGISRLQSFLDKKRYRVIFNYRQHIKIYSVLGLILACFSFFALQRNTQIALIIPCLLSAAYVIPFLAKGKRLRDFNDIKIFLIAICWSWITVVLPAIELGLLNEVPVWILALERSLFILLITLPFDIRDMEVDSYKSVKTLPLRLGLARTRWLGLSITILLIICSYFLTAQMQNFASIWAILLLSYACSLLLLWKSKEDGHDYYYTGLVDGMMLLQAIPLYFIL